MEEIIKNVLHIDEIWNTDTRREYVWGRMFFVYFFIYGQKKPIEDLLKTKLMTPNQVYYLVKKSRYNMEKNYLFRDLYSKIINRMIMDKYKITIFDIVSKHMM